MGGRGSSYSGGGGGVSDSDMSKILAGEYGKEFINNKSLTNSENLIIGYTDGMYKKLNKDLLSDNPSKDALFLKSKLNTALDNQKSYSGITYRTMNLNEKESKKLISTIKKEGGVTNKSFTSTSKEINTMFLEGSGKISFKIHGKTGKDISKIKTSEKEVLFKAGTKFTYHGVKKIIVDNKPGMTPKTIYQVTLKEKGAKFTREKKQKTKINNDPFGDTFSLFD
jgi:hypothetical protein